MVITRRWLLNATVGVGALAALPVPLRRAWAATEVPAGGGRLLSLSDGHLVLPESFVIGGLPEPEARAVLEAAGQAAPEFQAPCNVTLWQGNGATVLFDTGAGPDFMPTTGRLLDALAAAGIDPSEVTHVVFTHGHPDHLWGVLDEFDEPLFMGARHLMGGEEHSYWTDPATADSIGAERQFFAAGAARRLGILADLVETFADGDEILPGLRAVATLGHTPGHMSFAIGEGADGVFVVGDAIPNAHVALAKPAWELPSDQNPKTAAATRSALLARLAEEETRMIGYHFPDGGVGHIRRAGDAYTFVPEA